MFQTSDFLKLQIPINSLLLWFLVYLLNSEYWQMYCFENLHFPHSLGKYLNVYIYVLSWKE